MESDWRPEAIVAVVTTAGHRHRVPHSAGNRARPCHPFLWNCTSADNVASTVGPAFLRLVRKLPLQRRLHVEGLEFIIENGVGNDLLSSDMVTVVDGPPTREILCLTEGGYRFLVGGLDKRMLIDAGVLSPDEG